jgi:hypothetical protein
MKELKCKCGNKGCTTVIFIRQDQSITDVVIEAKNQNVEIALDANDIIILIKKLKEALNALT